MPEPQRLEYWLDMVCSLYCDLDCEPPAEERIFGDIRLRRLGELQFSSLRSNGRQVRRTPARLAASSDDHYLMLLLREGQVTVQQDGRSALLQPGDMVIKDCTRPFTMCFAPPFHDIQVLRLERGQVECHVRDTGALTATTMPGSGVAVRLLRTMLDALRDDTARMNPASALNISDAVAGVVGAALRELPTATCVETSNLRTYHLTRIKAYVRQHLRDPRLSVASVAAAMRLSPDYVAKLFSGEPVPLSRWLWQLRLDACRRELADPMRAGRTTSEIAFSWGFNDAAHFSRSFRGRFGMAPREWRLLSAAARPALD